MTDTLLDLTNALQTYIVSPLNAFGLGGFVFDTRTEDMAQLSADITDHYTESNRALQDHIAIKPKRITLRGFVGELVYNTPGQGNPTGLQTAVQKLTEVSAFLPQLSAAAVQAQQAISGIDSAGPTLASLSAAVPPAANIYALVKNSIGTFGPGARQAAAYQFFAACQSEAILMGIQTPWEFLTNMAVETIVAVSPEDSIFITDFAITFKQIRIAQSSTVATLLAGTGGILESGGPTLSGDAGVQAQPLADNGNAAGQTLPLASLPGNQKFITGAPSLAPGGNIAPIFKLEQLF